MKKKILLLLTVMLLLSFMGAIFVKLFDSKLSRRGAEDDRGINIVATFYPVYMIGLNLLDQVDEVQIHSLTELQTGCLHDYILTTEDMRLISEADVLVINGGGMESFLDDVKENYPKLTIIDASKGIEMLENTEGHEDHEDEEYERYGHEDAAHEDGDHEDGDHEESDHEATAHEDGVHEVDDHGHAHDHGLYNAHVWMDPQLYIKQINNVREGLINYINNNDEGTGQENKIEDQILAINQNADTYISKIQALDSEIEDFVAEMNASFDRTMSAKQAVIFHDSFVYLANRVGIKVAYTVPLDSDTSLSAGEIAEVIDIVNQEKIKLLFTEEQYKDSIAKQIENETGAKVQVIDTVVVGDGSKDSYLRAMRNNLLVLQKAMQ